MKARLIAALFTFTLTTLVGASVHAEEGDAKLACNQPGYVMEIVIVSTPHLGVPTALALTEKVGLAWQEPGYVQEVVVVKASRSEVLATTGSLENPVSPSHAVVEELSAMREAHQIAAISCITPQAL